LQRVGGDRETLYTFLTSMSGCFERDLDKRVIIIAATNNPQNIDRALTARGRFGTKIEFTYPEFRERKLFLESRLNALTLNMKSFDLDKLARETEGCSYEDLLAIIREAFLQAKIKGAIISQSLLEQALDSTVRNVIFEGQKELPEKELHIIATHMAGHALLATLLPTSKKLTKVTTLPILTEIEEEAVWDTYSKKDKDGNETNKKDAHITQYAQLFTYHDKDTLALSDEMEHLRLCTIELAGHLAEKLLLGSCGYCYHPEDTQKAYNLVKAIAFKGLQEKDLSEAEADRRKDMILALLKKCELDAQRLLEEHKPALQNLAKTLTEKKMLNASQVEAIIKQGNQETTQAPTTIVPATPTSAPAVPEPVSPLAPERVLIKQEPVQEKKLSETEIQKVMEQELGVPEVRAA
jgi:cell division protease FtsH